MSWNVVYRNVFFFLCSGATCGVFCLILSELLIILLSIFLFQSIFLCYYIFLELSQLLFSFYINYIRDIIEKNNVILKFQKQHKRTYFY